MVKGGRGWVNVTREREMEIIGVEREKRAKEDGEETSERG